MRGLKANARIEKSIRFGKLSVKVYLDDSVDIVLSQTAFSFYTSIWNDQNRLLEPL